MIKQRKKRYNKMNFVIVAELLLASPTKRTLERNMKKNKEVHSGYLHRSPACDIAQKWPSACLREWETAYLQVAGKKPLGI